MMEFTKEAELLEAILLLENRSLSVDQLSRLSDLPLNIVKSALQSLELLLSNSGGIELIEDEGGYALAPKAQLWPYLKERYGIFKNDKMTKSELEVLSAIAYSQPISRSDVDAMRGVNSESSLKRLLARHLITEVGRKEGLGKAILYGTTQDFLELFKLNSISDLGG